MEIVRLSDEDGILRLHSPFTGEQIETDEGLNEQARGLLFCYYGNAGMYAYIAKTFIDRIGLAPNDAEDMEPEDLAARATDPCAILFEVDTGWNGVNWYLISCP
jgi:hypothetical protein